MSRFSFIRSLLTDLMLSDGITSAKEDLNRDKKKFHHNDVE